LKSVQSWSVFLVSMSAIAYEVMLTRYFAIASWAEYGYWVISMAMTGYAFSGVLLSLVRTWAIQRSATFFCAIPVLLMFCAAGGFYFTAINPFNPYELQNAVLWKSQLVNIGRYYLALFPFFFLSGFFLGLCFAVFQESVSKLYAADLIGAGIGAVCILALMFVVHPFYLVCAIPCVLCFVAVLNAPVKSQARFAYFAVAGAAFIACEAVSILSNQARFFEYKAIYPVLHVEGNKVLDEVRSPRGYYLVLDNFTERRDLPISNNLSLMGSAGTPPATGLYKDGNRMMAILPKDRGDLSYVPATLSALPYRMRKGGAALLVGASGGFRIPEISILGCTDFVAIESDAVAYDLARHALGDSRGRFEHTSMQTHFAQAHTSYDIIDISEDYVDEGPANKYALTKESIRDSLSAMSPNGVLSLPMSIREFTVYAVRLTETVRATLVEMGILEPEKHIIVYRSEWSARILVSREPFSPADIEELKKFCSDMSFDTSYFPGIDPATVEVWNELPPFSLEDDSMAAPSEGPQDALRDDLMALFANPSEYTAKSFFNLSPASNDRPYIQYIFRPSRLGSLLSKLDRVPHEEVGFLTNMAVLVQSAIFATLVLLLPLARVPAMRRANAPIFRATVYFACLGLGFLGIEITLIEKCAYLLNDNVTAFALVLSGMLIFSGIGSALASHFANEQKKGLIICIGVIAASSLLFILRLDELLASALGMPYAVKCAVMLLAIAPVSLALGMPFALGMAGLKGNAAPILPMAWAVNGAFSVIATPLASILAVLYGYTVVFLLSLALYLIAYATLPVARGIYSSERK
jgi:hypothetical protein